MFERSSKSRFPGKGLGRKQELLQPGGKSCPVSTLLGKSARTSLSWDAFKAELKHLYPIHPIIPKHDKTYFSPAREDLRAGDLHKPKTDTNQPSFFFFSLMSGTWLSGMSPCSAMAPVSSFAMLSGTSGEAGCSSSYVCAKVQS